MKNLTSLTFFVILLMSCKDKKPVLPQPPVEYFQIDSIDLSNTNFNRRFGVYDMKFDSKDRIWLGTSSGLMMYDQQTKVWQIFDKNNFPPPPGFSIDYIVYNIEIDNNDNVYVTVGQVNHQLYIFNGTSWRTDSLAGHVRFLKNDKKNNILWVSTSAGLLSIKNGIKTLYNKSNSILTTLPPPNETSYYIFQVGTKPDGTVWLGADGDLLKFDGRNWQRFDNKMLPNKGLITNYLEVDSNGVVFVGISDVFYSFDGQNITNLTDSIKKYRTGNVFDFYCSPSTNNLFLQNGSDILYYNRVKNTYQVIDSKNSNLSQSGSSSCIAFDSKGDAWVAKSSFVGKLPVNIR